MNILYIGSSGALSLLPFKKLLTTNYSIAAVGIYQPVEFKNKIIALKNESLALAANLHDLAVIDLSQPTAQILQQCKALSIDLILISCYSKRLPEALVNFASKGCFNMHPSLLPSYRGSEPIFWQLQQASDVGVSWHRVTHDFDAGDIVAQKKVTLDDGADYAEINYHLAKAGAALMLPMLAAIAEIRLLNTPQDPALSSYQPYPAAPDFVVDVAWSAQQAYNFMCATRTFGYPYLCRLGITRYLLDEALDYDNNDSLQAVEVQGKRLYIPCNEGVLMTTFTAKL